MEINYFTGTCTEYSIHNSNINFVLNMFVMKKNLGAQEDSASAWQRMPVGKKQKSNYWEN